MFRSRKTLPAKRRLRYILATAAPVLAEATVP